METVVKTYQDKGYPIESIWADINYMDKKIDFTVDSLPGRPYEGLPMAVDKWHTQNVKFVPILDAGVSIQNDLRQNYYFAKG